MGLRVRTSLCSFPPSSIYTYIYKYFKCLIEVQLIYCGFPCDSDGKESACSAGDPGLITGLGRSPGEGNGNALQYSCLEDPMDGGAWQATVCDVAKSQTRLSDFTFFLSFFDLQ